MVCTNIDHDEQESRHGSGVCSFFIRVIRVIRGSHGRKQKGPRITRMTRIGKNEFKTLTQFACARLLPGIEDLLNRANARCLQAIKLDELAIEQLLVELRDSQKKERR